ncbi:MAG: hypothetical protein JRG92_20545, partial [Deltaproteobacteria bacterium]|nr:hypothetical protein [Deltaproteobacteria bacterium]
RQPAPGPPGEESPDAEVDERAEAALRDFVSYYNNEQYHESLDDVHVQRYGDYRHCPLSYND